MCNPSKNSLIQEKIEAPLSLEKSNLEKLTTDEFITGKEHNLLPPKCKKGIQEAIALFKFLEKKSDVSYAAVFTPPLGSIDEAAQIEGNRRLGLRALWADRRVDQDS